MSLNDLFSTGGFGDSLHEWMDLKSILTKKQCDWESMTWKEEERRVIAILLPESESLLRKEVSKYHRQHDFKRVRTLLATMHGLSELQFALNFFLNF